MATDHFNWLAIALIAGTLLGCSSEAGERRGTTFVRPSGTFQPGVERPAIVRVAPPAPAPQESADIELGQAQQLLRGARDRTVR